MATKNLLDEIRELMHQQVQCVLATLDGEQPCLHLMAYALSEDLTEIFLASYTDTRKVSNMLAQPSVALMWDNRTGNQQDHVQGLALNASGEAALLQGADREEAGKLLLTRNPTLGTLLAAERATIFSVRVDSYVYVRGYGKVQTYRPSGRS